MENLNYFGDILPDELILEITKYLNEESIAQLGSTCTKLRCICDPSSQCKIIPISEFHPIKNYKIENSESFYRNYIIKHGCKIVGFTFNGGFLYMSDISTTITLYSNKKYRCCGINRFIEFINDIKNQIPAILDFIFQTYSKILKGEITRSSTFNDINDLERMKEYANVIYIQNSKTIFDFYICVDKNNVNIILTRLHHYNHLAIPIGEIAYFLYRCNTLNTILSQKIVFQNVNLIKCS